jgi:hypothetical protein
MLQTLKLGNKKHKKSLFYEEKSLVGLTPDDQTEETDLPQLLLKNIMQYNSALSF